MTLWPSPRYRPLVGIPLVHGILIALPLATGHPGAASIAVAVAVWMMTIEAQLLGVWLALGRLPGLVRLLVSLVATVVYATSASHLTDSSWVGPIWVVYFVTQLTSIALPLSISRVNGVELWFEGSNGRHAKPKSHQYTLKHVAVGVFIGSVFLSALRASGWALWTNPYWPVALVMAIPAILVAMPTLILIYFVIEKGKLATTRRSAVWVILLALLTPLGVLALMFVESKQRPLAGALVLILNLGAIAAHTVVLAGHVVLLELCGYQIRRTQPP